MDENLHYITQLARSKSTTKVTLTWMYCVNMPDKQFFWNIFVTNLTKYLRTIQIILVIMFMMCQLLLSFAHFFAFITLQILSKFRVFIRRFCTQTRFGEFLFISKQFFTRGIMFLFDSVLNLPSQIAEQIQNRESENITPLRLLQACYFEITLINV